MIKTILVPTSGSNTDRAVFATALALARPLRAHLQFLHLHLTPEVAARQVPHFEFCQGAAISATLERLQGQGEKLSVSARQHFEAFCSENKLGHQEAPGSVEAVSAGWREETSEPLTEPLVRLLFHARHSDLTVVGRRHRNDHLPPGLIEDLLTGSGRPIVIAADKAPQDLATIVVGWKEASAAAHALAASLPLLKQAQRVVLLGVVEDGSSSTEALDDLARRLAWHGIHAAVSLVGSGSSPAARLLPHTAAQLGADLLVVGGFGRTPLREGLFGGVTRSLIDEAPLPILMVH
jgi:nucleotide-binding universal stress UspA family protein